MADCTHQYSFRHLLNDSDRSLCKKGAQLTSLETAQSITEYCWETRELNPDQENGWLDAMHNLGLRTALL